MKKGLISVVCPNYNHGHYITDMIESCLSQSYSHWELIIVDDASTDNSVEVSSYYANKYSNIHLLKNDKNQGAIRSVNRALKSASGDFYVMRSADDINLPGYFEAAIDLMHEHSEAALFCADIAFFRDSIENAQIERLLIGSESDYYSPDILIEKLGITPIHGHTVMIRSELLRQSGLFQERHGWYNDWLPYMSWAFRRGVVYSPVPYVGSRLLSESFCAKNSSNTDKQQEVVSSILKDLASNYLDVIDKFISSGSLGFFGESLNVVINKNSYLKQLFGQSSEQISKSQSTLFSANNGISDVITRVLYFNRDRIKKTRINNGNIWVYGAGLHTRILMECWQKLLLPMPHAIIVTEKNTGFSEYDTLDIQIIQINEAPISLPDLIIISSKSYEQEMVMNAKRFYPKTEILTFWVPDQ